MGLAVKTQYRLNGRASHRYWKLVTLPRPAHLFYCSHGRRAIIGRRLLHVHPGPSKTFTWAWTAVMGSWLNECQIVIAVVTRQRKQYITRLRWLVTPQRGELSGLLGHRGHRTQGHMADFHLEERKRLPEPWWK